MGPGGLSRERAGFEVRDAHATHYGRICPVETPEGANIGLVLNMSNYGRVNDYGFLETPYIKVISNVTPKKSVGHIARVNLEDEKGKIIVKKGSKITAAAAKRLEKVKGQSTWPVKPIATNDIVYLDAADEEHAVIASAGEKVDKNGYFVDARVSARAHYKTEDIDSDDVTHMDSTRKQIIGSSASLIPFIEKNYVYRSLMGSNQQRQAVPLVRPQSPVVGTGAEDMIARNTGQFDICSRKRRSKKS